jgi:hypothetical protein
LGADGYDDEKDGYEENETPGGVIVWRTIRRLCHGMTLWREYTEALLREFHHFCEGLFISREAIGENIDPAQDDH